MSALVQRRIRPFAILGGVGVIVGVAIARLPDIFVAQLARRRTLTDPQAGWAYRLLALAAIAQALYAGFVLFRPERLARARSRDPRLRALPTPDVVASVARNAAAIAGLTMVYGIAAFIVTGQRGGFWLFPLLAVAQAAWYYRHVGEVARWMELQADEVPQARSKVIWQREPRDYSPPLVRTLLEQSAEAEAQDSPAR